MGFMALSWAVEQDTASTHAFAVLCALAGYADENGECWPSQTTIAEKTRQSDRSVRNQIQSLINTGHLVKKEVAGRSGYKLSMTNDRNHVPLERNVIPVVENTKPEPLSSAPEPLSAKPEPRSYESERISNESVNTKKSPSGKKGVVLAERPQEVCQETWDDFKHLRSTKKADLTKTALSRIAAEATKAGYSLEDALQECCARNWQAFKADWVENSKGDKRKNNKDPSSKALSKKTQDENWAMLQAVAGTQ